MGLPKKMKLGANKVRGANYRLMLTAWSGEEPDPISLQPHPCPSMVIHSFIWPIKTLRGRGPPYNFTTERVRQSAGGSRGTAKVSVCTETMWQVEKLRDGACTRLGGGAEVIRLRGEEGGGRRVIIAKLKNK